MEQAAPPPIVLMDTLFARQRDALLYTHSFAEQTISSCGFGVDVPVVFCVPFGVNDAHSVSLADIACWPSTLMFGLQQWSFLWCVQEYTLHLRLVIV